MLGLTGYLGTTKRERMIALAIGAIVGLSILAPASAHASGCTNSWTNAAGGSWFEGGNWSKGAVPTAEEDACITLNGTYTVTVTQTGPTVSVHSLTVGGESGTQTLAIGSSCSANATLTTTAGTSNGVQGAITLTNGDGCANSATLSGPVTNAGTLTTELAHGGGRTLQGNITNTGTLAINANTSYNGASALLTNKGTLNLAEATQLTASNASAVTNGSGGKIVATGNADVSMGSGTTFTEGAGTTSGTKPVIVDDGTLSYIGGGKSLIALHGSSAVSGNLAGGQSLAIESTSGEHAVTTAGASFTNGGAITLTNGDGAGNNATLVVSAGTLTNTGTITTEPAHGGFRTIQGSMKNTGTLAINVSTAYSGKSALLGNEGALDLAEGTQLTVSNGGSFTNGAGGKVIATGGSDLLMGSGTSFTEGAGTTSGAKPVIVDDGTLTYTGTGTSAIALHGSSSLNGSLSAGQTLSIESTSSEHAFTTAGASLTNAGAITLTNGDGAGNNATLVISPGATLTNSGKITTEPAHGGTRTIQGNLTNTGTFAVKVSTAYDGAAAALINEGAVNLSEGTQLAVSNGGSFTNGTGGTITSIGGSDLFMGSGTSFTEGAGTTSGAKPVIVDDGTLTYTGTGTSAIALHGSSSLNGSLSAGQTLSIESTSSEHAFTTAGASLTNAGAITLTNGDGAGNNATLVISPGATLTNSGKIFSEPANGGTRTIQGNLTNQLTGTVGIKTNTLYNTAAVLTNEGTINIAEGVLFSVSGGGTVFNDSGGNIIAAGNGAFSQTGGTFNEVSGKTSGTEPVLLDDATLNYPGSTAAVHGSGRISLRGSSSLAGNIRQGEVVVIASTCGEHAVVNAATSFFSAGKIELTNGDGCANNATLNVPKGGKFENTGTLNVVNPHGGARVIQGNVVSNGALSLAAGETLQINGNYQELAGSKVKVFIASASSFGALSVTGSAKLAGALTLFQVSPFKASLGQKYAIVGSSSLTGTFEAETEDQVDSTGLYYQPTYSATAMTLLVAQATASLSTSKGLPGSPVTVSGSGYLPGDTITPTFIDHKGATTVLPPVTTNGSGEFSTEITIPESAAVGVGRIKVTSTMTGVHIANPFQVG